MITVSRLLSIIEFFVSLLQSLAAKHETKAADLQKGIEALHLEQQSNFAEAIRARNVADKIGTLIS